MTVVSVSRRTDIPALYPDWFINRLSEGYAISVNPFNLNQANWVSLEKCDADCFVFWSKNPRPLLDSIDRLDGYCYYFQYTLNAYGSDLEPGVPGRGASVATFTELSERIGKEKVIWRYDPVVTDDVRTAEWHIAHFGELAAELSPYTEKCVFSFADPYRKGLRIASDGEMVRISEAFSEICGKHGLELCTCSERMKFPGISRNKCIDDVLIRRLSGKTVDARRDGQREYCGCVRCSDIGAYDSCTHGCTYCYANRNQATSERNRSMHDPESEILIGHISDETVIYRNGKAIDKCQRHL